MHYMIPVEENYSCCTSSGSPAKTLTMFASVRAGAEVLRKLPMLAHVDLRLSGSEGAGDATRSAVQSLAMCSRLVRGLPGDTLCA